MSKQQQQSKAAQLMRCEREGGIGVVKCCDDEKPIPLKRGGTCWYFPSSLMLLVFGIMVLDH